MAKVKVKGYTRNGKRVKGYTRSAATKKRRPARKRRK